jgi:Ankyrin repeats (many copies)
MVCLLGLNSPCPFSNSPHKPCKWIVRQLLNLGVDVRAIYENGDGYFDIAKNSTALHVAAWKAYPGTVKVLIKRGAPVDSLDGKGRTPLALLFVLAWIRTGQIEDRPSRFECCSMRERQ